MIRNAWVLGISGLYGWPASLIWHLTIFTRILSVVGHNITIIRVHSKVLLIFLHIIFELNQAILKTKILCSSNAVHDFNSEDRWTIYLLINREFQVILITVYILVVLWLANIFRKPHQRIFYSCVYVMKKIKI